MPKFPSVKRLRTTVAPTEFIITNERTFKAGFAIRPEPEIAQFIAESVDQAVTTAFLALRARDDIPDLTELLENSPDQRFRLSCFLGQQTRSEIAQELLKTIVPRIVAWADSNDTFQAGDDESTIVELGLVEFASELQAIKNRVRDIIATQVRLKCGHASGMGYPESFVFETTDRGAFIEKIKDFLSIDEGSISPAVGKARVRGSLRSEIVPVDLELVIVDGEGIGHDTKEHKFLSARHYDYFFESDAIVLVEDSETPFRGGGKSALASIEKNGYLPKVSLVFSRLDRVESENEERRFQKREVEKALRNVLHALRDEQVMIERQSLDVRFLGNMHQPTPDAETIEEIQNLLLSLQERHGAARTCFVAPHYDYELLAGFLVQATDKLRQAWAGYIQGEGGTPATPWQTQKAFTKRMSWREDEYRYLKPVAEFKDLLITGLRSVTAHVLATPWRELGLVRGFR